MPTWLALPDPVHHALLVLAPLFPLLLALLGAHTASARWLTRAAPLATIPAWLLVFAGSAERAWPDLLLGLVLGIDLPRSAWLALTLLLWTCATWFGVTYMAHDEPRRRPGDDGRALREALDAAVDDVLGHDLEAVLVEGARHDLGGHCGGGLGVGAGEGGAGGEGRTLS